MDDSTPAPAAFSVAATTSLQERRARTLKYGDTFALFDGTGDIPEERGGTDGLFHRDTRHLSCLELRMSGAPPMLLSSTMRDDNAALTCDLSNPDLRDGGSVVLEHDQLHVRRTKFLWNATCFERIAIRNFSDRTCDVALSVRYAADFADLFEVRGRKRAARGVTHAPAVNGDNVVLAYTGLDGTRRETRLCFDPAPAQIGPSDATFRFELRPGGREVIHLEIQCEPKPSSQGGRHRFFDAMRAARRHLRSSAGRAASVAGANEVFNEMARRSVADLYMLVSDTPQGPMPYAGIPWFSTAFGRDAILTALMTLWMDPELARGVLGFLAANQATGTDAAADAEPGKILHETRQGEMAVLGEVPFRRYYGSVDSTPLFVLLAGEYWRRTGDLTTTRALWPHVEAALGWIERDGDRDGDGFVEYFRQTEKGLANQGWKDSHDSIFHDDGSPAEGPIALVEVQGYVYGAQRAAAEMAAALGKPERAAALTAAAAALRARIDEAFWCADLGTYALALDGAKRPCRVRTSNAGHLLMAGVPDASRAALLAAHLNGTTMYSGWGVRTLASGEPRYNPMSYHNGSVWPHDNAVIGIGLGRYGMRAAAARLLEGLFGAAVHIDLRRLPELICGFPRRQGQGPTFYPVACAPQAWASAAPLSLLQSCLGIGFDLTSRTVTFDRPALPRFMDALVLRNLAIGDARLDVAFQRAGETTAMSVIGRTGDIHAGVTD